MFEYRRGYAQITVFKLDYRYRAIWTFMSKAPHTEQQNRSSLLQNVSNISCSQS